MVLWARAEVLLHTVANGQYGFHHDELATLDDTRSMAWGYAAYPPLTPFLTRIAFILFGPSLIGLRFFAAVALGLVLVLTGVARHLGGGKAGTNRGSAGRGDRRGGGCMATTCKGLVSGR